MQLVDGCCIVSFDILVYHYSCSGVMVFSPPKKCLTTRLLQGATTVYGSKQCGRAFNYGSDRWCDCVPAEADDYCKFTPYRNYAKYLFKAESSATVSRSNKSFPAPNHLRLCRKSPKLLIVQHARQRADSAQQHRYGAVLPRHFLC